MLFFAVSCHNVKIALSNSNLIPVRYISNLTSPFQLDSSKSHRGTRVMQLLLPSTDIQVDGCLICKPFSKKTETNKVACNEVYSDQLTQYYFFFFLKMIIIVKRKGEER